MVAGRNPNLAALQLLPLLAFLHLELGKHVETLRQQTCKQWRHVLHNHDGHGKIRREGAE